MRSESGQLLRRKFLESVAVSPSWCPLRDLRDLMFKNFEIQLFLRGLGVRHSIICSADSMASELSFHPTLPLRHRTHNDMQFILTAYPKTVSSSLKLNDDF
jgi:hypothetical protein